MPTAKKQKQTPQENHAREQAQAQLESIREMVTDLEAADDITRDDDTQANIRERAEQTIREDALEIATRSDWHSPGDKAEEVEYKILLCTGGPAVRIIGELNDHGEPESAVLEYQDWGTPWTEYRISRADEEILLAYARVFYFGE